MQTDSTIGVTLRKSFYVKGACSYLAESGQVIGFGFYLVVGSLVCCVQLEQVFKSLWQQ
jgi:hypothetical protein